MKHSCFVFFTFLSISMFCALNAEAGKESEPLRVGVTEGDITPPLGFPMAGYYHERLAEGAIDPLKVKVMVFRDGTNSAALVVCDLIGIATDLSKEVRKRASKATGIPEKHIVLAATHTHTAPSYIKELYLYLGDDKQEELRAKYIQQLIAVPVALIKHAYQNAQPVTLKSGVAIQETPVSFNRRFVMKDGSVQTWQRYSNPDVVRAAGPIDTEIGLLQIVDSKTEKTKALLSNFALHLDTVGGLRWSADYPFFIEQTMREKFGAGVVSIFATGCCGDINHSNPNAAERNKVDFIGLSLADSIQKKLDDLSVVENTKLNVQSETVELPLEGATKEEVLRSVEVIQKAQSGEKVNFYDHVTAHKKLILDQLLHKEPFVNAVEYINWGVSRSLAGIGDHLPVDVTVIAIGNDTAIVCLPGEVFVELGLAIKQASPFKHTIIVELSNTVETIYIPHRAAYAGGSYEVTNSSVLPGSGEMLVESAVRLLRKAATSK